MWWKSLFRVLSLAESIFCLLFAAAFVLRISLIDLAAAPRLCFSAKTFDLSFSSSHG